MKALMALPVLFALSLSTAFADDFASLNSQIETLSGKDLSCQTASDCTSVAVGARACGGPERYVITSLNNPELNTLLDLAKELSDKQAAYNEENGIISICLFAVAPGLKCVSNTCQAAQPTFFQTGLQTADQ